MVCGPNVDETLSLLCSGARVLCTGTEMPSAISIAESSGQALQTELLRHNEFVGMFLMLLKASKIPHFTQIQKLYMYFLQQVTVFSDFFLICVYNALF